MLLHNQHARYQRTRRANPPSEHLFCCSYLGDKSSHCLKLRHWIPLSRFRPSCQQVHVVKPMNFSLSDKHVKRSGLDYWPHVDLVVHENWGDFAEASAGGTHFYFTRAADVSALDVDYTAAATAALAPCAENRGSGTEKVYLLFGAETTGFTPEAEAASRAGGVGVATC